MLLNARYGSVTKEGNVFKILQGEQSGKFSIESPQWWLKKKLCFSWFLQKPAFPISDWITGNSVCTPELARLFSFRNSYDNSVSNWDDELHRNSLNRNKNKALPQVVCNTQYQS